MNFKHFFVLRYVAFIAVVCSFLASLLMFINGATKTFQAFHTYFVGLPTEESFGELNQAEVSVIFVIESVDAFLFALVLMIFSFGMYMLFIKNSQKHEDVHEVEWLKIENIEELKKTLAYVIVIILFVQFLKQILIHLNQLSWQQLVIPIAILLLSLSLFLLSYERPKVSEVHSAHSDRE